jgi:hypothetical protein
MHGTCRYTPFLLRWPVRLLVLSLFIAYLIASIVGADHGAPQTNSWHQPRHEIHPPTTLKSLA